ncbi:MAG TPA: ATP-binding protein, partial [Ohtaekwangia sp.]|nr:ATP-binding protein [Ohtaekwangia sp.]
INHSAIRVRELVEVLAHYTALATDSRKKEAVDLNLMFNLLTNKFREEFDKKNALLQLQGLSTVQGYPDQLRLLFECLIDNSLKFSKDNQSVVIKVSKQQLLDSDPETFRSQCAFKIVYQDNGIGFDNAFAEKIFSMFRRLQTSSEGDGKGIGLSIVKRVMTNHSGFVLARGKPNEGAEFVLYFPDH